MVLEVVSATSERKDLRDLVAGYAETGVLEYWIADARGPETRLRILALEGGRYADQTTDPEGYLSSGIFGASFRTVRISDPSGLPAFRLDSR
jgi:Uma2 family endonuclease